MHKKKIVEQELIDLPKYVLSEYVSNEVYVKIFSRLNQNSLRKMCEVCKKWRNIIMGHKNLKEQLYPLIRKYFAFLDKKDAISLRDQYKKNEKKMEPWIKSLEPKDPAMVGYLCLENTLLNCNSFGSLAHLARTNHNSVNPRYFYRSYQKNNVILVVYSSLTLTITSKCCQ
jgi:hypothetical protein